MPIYEGLIRVTIVASSLDQAAHDASIGVVYGYENWRCASRVIERKLISVKEVSESGGSNDDENGSLGYVAHSS